MRRSAISILKSQALVICNNLSNSSPAVKINPEDVHCVTTKRRQHQHENRYLHQPIAMKIYNLNYTLPKKNNYSEAYQPKTIKYLCLVLFLSIKLKYFVSIFCFA